MSRKKQIFFSFFLKPHAFRRIMEWILSALRFKISPDKRRCKFHLVHFDNPEFPVVPGHPYEGSQDDGDLEKAKDELGSVLWLDAINLFLPYLCSDLLKSFGTSKKLAVLCLGEGTGACGIGISSCPDLSIDRIIITDLPPLLPLLTLNASLNNFCEAKSLDWTKRENFFTVNNCYHEFNVVVACEVLYGNRFAWQALMNTIIDACRNKPSTLVYICVTLRNARHDLEDFWNQFLAIHFMDISEIVLSDNVSVIRATRLVI